MACKQTVRSSFARHDAVYAVYLPDTTTTGRIDLSHAKGALRLRWHNPRTGRFEGGVQRVMAGDNVRLDAPAK